MDPSEKTEPAKPTALKDRIADLRLTARAGEAGEAMAAKLRALQAAAPGAAADLAARVKAGIGSAKLDRINRETLKAGRDGLAAKVEALLKPRPVDDTPQAAKTAQDAGSAATAADSESDPNIAALKAKLDAALRPKDEAGVTVKPDAASAGIVARIAEALPKRERTARGWTVPFARSKRDAATTATPQATTRRPIETPTDDVAPEVTPAVERTQRTVRTEAIIARTRPRRALLSLGMLATALVTGGVLHIATTFAIPALNSGSAFDRIKWQLDVNAMKVLAPDPTGAMPLPFLSPDMRYAFCRFDITAGPVAVSAVLPDVGWSLALYTPQGDNFYAVPGQEGRLVEAVFNINPASDRLLIPVPGQRRADVDAAQVTSAAREGLVVIRAPNKGAAYAPAADAALRKATCRAVERR